MTTMGPILVIAGVAFGVGLVVGAGVIWYWTSWSVSEINAACSEALDSAEYWEKARLRAEHLLPQALRESLLEDELLADLAKL